MWPPPLIINDIFLYDAKYQLPAQRARCSQLLMERDGGVHLGGGTQTLGTHLTKSADERVMRLSTVNRNHGALIGV